jgi:hypothetical protein
MIILNGEKGFVEVASWEDITSRPGYAANLNPKEHKLKSIIGRYSFAEEIRCGLSDCHQRHKKGYLAVTETGAETNIGKDCGATYFGIEFKTIARTFDRDVATAKRRETLTALTARLDGISQRIAEMRSAPRGADWVHRQISYLTNPARCEVAKAVSAMKRARRNEIFIERPATKAEADVLRESTGRPGPHFIKEVYGHLDGLEALYAENDLRQLLIIELEQKIAAFRSASIETMEDRDLRRWARWAGTIDSTLQRAGAAIETGRRLFVVKNLRNLRRAIPHGSPQFSFLAFLEELEEESAPTA